VRTGRCDSLKEIGGSVRSIVVATCLALVVASCGGGELTLTEYAGEVEGLVTHVSGRIDDLEAEWESAIPTVESTQAYLNARVAARQEFLEGFGALEPPEEVTEMHTVALDILTRLTAAEEAWARRAEDIETTDELSLLWDSPEALALQAVDEEAIAICRAAQAQFDSTADREVFADFPWVPPELQEVVLVFLGCTEQERGGGS
jgi:hypothetical protein